MNRELTDLELEAVAAGGKYDPNDPDPNTYKDPRKKKTTSTYYRRTPAPTPSPTPTGDLARYYKSIRGN